MKLYLVQHGEALPEEINPERSLSEKGQIDVKKMAEFLRNAPVKVDIIWQSGKTRARQTAEILAEVVSSKEAIVQKEGLAPNDAVEDLQKELMEEEKDLMVVGHLPSLARLASALLSDLPSSNLVVFKQGGVVCLERLEDKSWQITFMIIPDLLEGT